MRAAAADTLAPRLAPGADLETSASGLNPRRSSAGGGRPRASPRLKPQPAITNAPLSPAHRIVSRAPATPAADLTGDRHRHLCGDPPGDGRPLQKKTALVVELLRAVLRAIFDTLPGVARPGVDPRRLRRCASPLRTLPARYRNNQEARGPRVWLPAVQTDLCWVTALDACLVAAGATDSPAVLAPSAGEGAEGRKGTDRYPIGTNPTDTDSVALVVKNWTRRCPFDARAP